MEVLIVNKPISKGNLVEEFKLGNTRIKIYDSAYIDKTPEDIERILQNIANITLRYYQRKEREEENVI